jgi:transcription antitermination factor NusG
VANIDVEVYMDPTPWSVLHVVANHEKRVAKVLCSRSLEYFLPLYSEQSHWTDRTVTLDRPLFPGYLFVRLTPKSRIPAISTPGVLRLLGDGQTQTVSQEEVDRIREGLVSGYILRPHAPVSVGTKVRICRGLFKEAVGLVTEFRHRCNVIISLAALQNAFSLEVALSDISVISEELPKPLWRSAPTYNAVH